jgi:hypothetical protein
MTFEEFLIKKKIDPVQLQSKEQSFFSEFESHFLQMGEKSFDHSKKFWFNKLRRTYHLKEEIKVVEIPAIIQEKSSIEPSNQEKTIYKPRFTAQIVESEEKQSEIEGESAPALNENPKSAYKPRFKPGMIKKNPESE